MHSKQSVLSLNIIILFRFEPENIHIQQVPYMAAMFGFFSLNRWDFLLVHSFCKLYFDICVCRWGKLFLSLSEHTQRSLFGSLPEGSLSEPSKEILSALFVGVEASLLLSPLELVRIQGQNVGRGGLLKAGRFVVHELGIAGMMKRVSFYFIYQEFLKTNSHQLL